MLIDFHSVNKSYPLVAFITSALKLQSTLTLNTVLRLLHSKSDHEPSRKESLHALATDFSHRLTSYRTELGPNAYALFNTLTDIAARPPESVHLQKNRDTIEKRSGRWLKELASQSQAPGFDLDAWIPSWAAGNEGRQNSKRN